MIIKSNVQCTDLEPELKGYFNAGGIYSTETYHDVGMDWVFIRDPYGEKWNAYVSGDLVKLYGFEAVFKFV